MLAERGLFRPAAEPDVTNVTGQWELPVKRFWAVDDRRQRAIRCNSVDHKSGNPIILGLIRVPHGLAEGLEAADVAKFVEVGPNTSPPSKTDASC
jgi:hypothetical protein